jgi:hypothetical protein
MAMGQAVGVTAAASSAGDGEVRGVGFSVVRDALASSGAVLSIGGQEK